MSYIAPTVKNSKFEADLKRKLPAHAWNAFCDGSLLVLRKKIAAKETQERREFERKGTVYRHFQKCANGGVEPKSTVKRHHVFSTIYPGTRTANSHA